MVCKKKLSNVQNPAKSILSYLSKIWNPTNVLDHVAYIMTYVRNVEDKGQHGIELDPTVGDNSSEPRRSNGLDYLSGSDGTKWKQIDIFSPPLLAVQSTLQCVRHPLPVWSQEGEPSAPLLIHGLSNMNLNLSMFHHQTILSSSTGPAAG